MLFFTPSLTLPLQGGGDALTALLPGIGDWLVILALGYVWALCAVYWLLAVYPEQETDLPAWYRRWVMDDDQVDVG